MIVITLFFSSFQYWKAPSMCLLVGHDDQNPAYVPQRAGLSSSSALVVAAAMATMRLSDIEIDAVGQVIIGPDSLHLRTICFTGEPFTTNLISSLLLRNIYTWFKLITNRRWSVLILKDFYAINHCFFLFIFVNCAHNWAFCKRASQDGICK